MELSIFFLFILFIYCLFIVWTTEVSGCVHRLRTSLNVCEESDRHVQKNNMKNNRILFNTFICILFCQQLELQNTKGK